jgi:3-phenylpropionate/cinnamic acid dioxygenase small subunit
LSTAITLGYKKVSSTPVKETLKVVSSVEVKTPVAPVYEIKVCNNFHFLKQKTKNKLFSFINVSYFKLETTAEIPRVNNRWNNEQLLQQGMYE